MCIYHRLSRCESVQQKVTQVGSLFPNMGLLFNYLKSVYKKSGFFHFYIY